MPKIMETETLRALLCILGTQPAKSRKLSGPWGTSRSFAQSQQLLTHGEVFEDSIFASTKDAAKPAEEVPEPHDHGKNLIRRRQSS